MQNTYEVSVQLLQNQNKNSSRQSILQETLTCACHTILHSWKNIATLLLFLRSSFTSKMEVNNNKASNIFLLTKIHSK